MVKAIKKNKILIYILAFSLLFFVVGILLNRQICPSNDLLQTMIESFSLHNNGNFLVINKGEKKLFIYENFNKVNSYIITIGKKPGNKRKSGDNRTPEGIFIIKSIDNSTNWVYDYPNDTLGPIVGAYGHWFIRLDVPGFNGIGIHGFFHDDALGERASHGCVRLNNKKLEEVVNFVKPGMPVIILPGDKDLEINRADLKIKAPQ